MRLIRNKCKDRVYGYFTAMLFMNFMVMLLVDTNPNEDGFNFRYEDSGAGTEDLCIKKLIIKRQS